MSTGDQDVIKLAGSVGRVVWEVREMVRASRPGIDSGEVTF